MQRYCLALDLKNDEQLIKEYKKYHEKVWPEIEASIKQSGIEKLEIYLVENRLFMIIDANDTFSFETKVEADRINPKVQEWETLMWNYQQAIPHTKSGEKWRLMKNIYNLQ